MATKAITDGYNYGPPVLVVVPGGAPLNATGDIEAGDPANGGSPVVVSPPAVVQKPQGGADLSFGSYHLVPTVGTVTTPDPGPLPAQYLFAFKVQGPADVSNTIVSQWRTAGQLSFAVTRHRGDVYFYINTTANGVTGPLLYTPSTPVADVAETLAVGFDRTAGIVRSWTSPDAGATWNAIGSQTFAPFTWFDSIDPVRIGAVYENTAAFTGSIWWVEARTGLDPAAGTVLWRFDADDYPGTGTVYTDPRGRTWTSTSTAAIVPD